MRPADLTLALLRQGQPATLRVQGRSMWPTLVAGDEVIIAPQNSYQIGDLVAFDDGREALVLHRVIAQRSDQLRTRGDSMVQADPWLDLHRVVGGVVGVKRGWLSALYNYCLPSRWLGAVDQRLRRRWAECRTWTLSGNALYVLYRTLLRPFQPSIRLIIAASSEPREVSIARGFELKEGRFIDWREGLINSGLQLPQYYDDSTYGVVAFYGLNPIACAWTSQSESGFATLHDSYVLADYRGLGLATSLADWILNYRAPDVTMVAALQIHNSASRAKNRRAGFKKVGREYRFRLWPTRKVWIKRSAKPGCEELVDAWVRNAETKVRR